MIKYGEIKPKVYIETTVVSYLVARLSEDATLGARQRATRQLWEDYSDNFELIEERHMKEKQHPPMDPILEECYKMKEEFAARFKNMQELVDYLKAENIRNKAAGWKYISPPSPPTKHHKQD